MEFSLVIPEAVKRILKEEKMQNIEKKKCTHCTIPCDSLTKFICLGSNAATIGEYIQKHPNEVNDMEKLTFEEDDEFYNSSLFSDEDFI